jgi:hypothetical protein
MSGANNWNLSEDEKARLLGLLDGSISLPESIWQHARERQLELAASL